MISNRPTKYTFLYAYFCHLEEPLIIYFYYLAFCYSRGHLSFIDIWTSATCDATYHSFILVGFLPLRWRSHISFISIIWALLQYFQITVTSIKCIMLYNIHTIYCPQWKLIKTNHYCYIPVKPSHNHHSFSTFKYIFLQQDLWHFKEIPIYINLHICIPMWMSVD